MKKKGFVKRNKIESKERRERRREVFSRGSFEKMAEKARSGEQESRAGIQMYSCLRGEPTGIFVVIPLRASIYRSIFHPLLCLLNIVG